MKKLLTGLSILASMAVFAYEPIDTPDTPNPPRPSLHSTCVSIVLSSGAKLTRELDEACGNTSSTIDIEAIAEVSKYLEMTASLIQACTDVPSLNELECIKERVASRRQNITLEAIDECKYTSSFY